MASDPSYPDSELAKMIRTARIRMGLSHARLGAVVDRTATTIRRWERGELVPPDDVLPVIARALDLEVEQLTRAAHGPDAHVVVPTPLAEAVEDASSLDEDAGEEPEAVAPKPIRPGIALVPAGGDETPGGEIAVVGGDEQADEGDGGRQPWFDVSDEQIKTASPAVASAPAAPKTEVSPAPPVPVVPVVPAVSPPTTETTAQPTTSMSEATQPVAATIAPPPQAVAVVPPVAWQQLPSYVEDPRERWRYVFRAILTIVILVIMAYVLLWATGEFLGLFDDVFQDTFSDPNGDVTTTSIVPLP